MASPLETPIQYLKGVGPALAKRLAKLDIFTAEDLLYTFPRAYDDRRQIPKIAAFKPNETQSCVATVVSLREIDTRGRLKILKATLKDATGECVALWFNQAYLKKTLSPGSLVYVRGKYEYNTYEKQFQLAVSETDSLGSAQQIRESTGRIVPVYPLVAGLYQSKMRHLLKDALTTYLPKVADPLPRQVQQQEELLGLRDALRKIHFPDAITDYKQAEERLAFDELFYFQCGLAQRRQDQQLPNQAEPLIVTHPVMNSYLENLPYSLTAAQQRCVNEIYQDLASTSVMNRLLQGDVGSGKTDVAAMTLLSAIASGKKGAIMAPTQILAEQHYIKFQNLLGGLGIDVYLVKGNMRAKAKRDTLEKLAEDKPLVVVGTHALIEDTVHIPNLAVAVIDEQHRFGVVQRMKLKEKSPETNCLFMTATPIPRTFMLTAFGDLDKSIIDEMPPGRVPQKTYFARESSLHKVYNHCRDDLAAGRQLYVVYPLVKESEKMDLKSAEEGYDYLKSMVYKEHTVDMLHGKMKPQEKTNKMAAFKAGDTQVLVSTTVIEVGVDVPNATMMIIQHAERFGLSQLHQLRGRIGRGGNASTCYLIGDPQTPSGHQRLKAMVDTTDGFKLAELDLKIRGPGDMLGVKQAGMPSFRIADIVKDELILKRARAQAFALVQQDPEFNLHPKLKDEVARRGDRFAGKQLN